MNSSVLMEAEVLSQKGQLHEDNLNRDFENYDTIIISAYTLN